MTAPLGVHVIALIVERPDPDQCHHSVELSFGTQVESTTLPYGPHAAVGVHLSMALHCGVLVMLCALSPLSEHSCLPLPHPASRVGLQ